jgi:hypothetical protein
MADAPKKIAALLLFCCLFAGFGSGLYAQAPDEARGFGGDGLHLYPLGWSSEGRWGALIGQDGSSGDAGVRIVVIDAVTDEILHRSELLEWDGAAGFSEFWSLYGSRIMGIAASFRLELSRRPDVRDVRFFTGGVTYDFYLSPPSPAAGAYVLRIRSSRGDSKDVYRSPGAGAPVRSALLGALVSPFEERALAVIRERTAGAGGGPAVYRFSGAHLTQGFAYGSSGSGVPQGSGSPGGGSIIGAVFNGQEYLLKARLAAGADPNEKDERGYPALLLAARLGHWSMVPLLLSAGALPGPADAAGRTALHYAAFAGDEASVSVLLSAGADRGAVDGGGLKPADLAADPALRAKLR